MESSELLSANYTRVQVEEASPVIEPRLSSRLKQMARSREHIIFESPMGAISQAGILRIQNYLKSTVNPHIFPQEHDLEWVWVTKRGTFPKRVAKWYRRKTDVKLSNEILSELGNIARANSEDTRMYYFDVTNRLDWGRSDFGQAGSCWWSNNGNGDAETFLNEGGYAVRFYDLDDESAKNDYWSKSDGCGRLWIYPFDRTNCAVAFNGYWNSDGATLRLARVFATYLGVTYRDVNLGSEGFYINCDTQYMLGGEADLEANYKAGSSVDLPIYCEAGYTCDGCGNSYSEDDIRTTEYGEAYCEDCYSERFATCEHGGRSCMYDISRDDAISVHVESRYGGNREETWCSNCTENFAACCDDCGEYYDGDRVVYCEDRSESLCPECAPDAGQCDECGDTFAELNEYSGGNYCPECHAEVARVCAHCDYAALDREFREVSNDRMLCDECFASPDTARMRDDRTIELPFDTVPEFPDAEVLKSPGNNPFGFCTCIQSEAGIYASDYRCSFCTWNANNYPASYGLILAVDMSQAYSELRRLEGQS